MQNRTVLRVVDALRSQGRLIIHLDCGHNHTIWQSDIEARPWVFDGLKEHAGKKLIGVTFACDVCPDPPSLSPTEIRQAKTAVQLWKEAGEP